MDRDRELLAECWLELSEVNDRTSPEEYPEMCLITQDELGDYMARAREEAAKVAETADVPVAGEYNQSVAKIAAGYIAAAIRSHKGGSNAG